MDKRGTYDMKKLVIIEDDKLFNEVLYQFLVKAEYGVQRAFSFAEGILLIEEDIDLIIIDINLPDGDGLELCRRARDCDQIPVIFLTARDEEEDMIRAFDLGADDYLVKPFPMNVLLKHIEAVLRRTEEEKDVFRYMDLAVDFGSRQVSYQGNQIKLTSKEYLLLEILIRNKGQVVTKELILDKVWDAGGAFVEEHTVNVTMSRLRKKIEPDPANPMFIKNVFGLGYVFGK